MEDLKYFKIECKYEGNPLAHSGYIAADIGQSLIEKRLATSPLIQKFSVEAVSKDDVKFPVTLIGLNNKYHDWEALQKDYLVYKLSGADV